MHANSSTEIAMRTASARIMLSPFGSLSRPPRSMAMPAQASAPRMTAKAMPIRMLIANDYRRRRGQPLRTRGS